MLIDQISGRARYWDSNKPNLLHCRLGAENGRETDNATDIMRER